MKILMICTEKLPVPPILGGAIQTYISGSLPHLSEVHDITVLGISDSSLPNRETIDGIHYERVPGKVFEIYREGVVRYVESNQFDLIHIFNRPRLVMPIRNVAPQTKITLSMHNDMFYPEKIDPEEAKAAIEEVSNIVTISNYVGNVIRNLYPQASSKLRTIYSGVDTERFLPGNHSKMQKIRNEIRKENGLENKTVILFAGRLSNNKGVDKLVRALPELSRKFNDLALVIVGSKWFSDNEVTDYVAYVRALSKKLSIPVVTTGFVSPSEIQNWFAAADLFVCTSQWQEPLARVHYEAMAAGLPIVTTTRGGNAEVILVRENGLLVENPEDPGCFAEKITEILSDQSLMNKMGQKGRELAISLYGWERVASDLLEVWEQSIKMPVIAITQEAANDNSDHITQEDTEDESNYITQEDTEDESDYITQEDTEDESDYITQEDTEDESDYITQEVTEDESDYITQEDTEDESDYITQEVTKDESDYITQEDTEDESDQITQEAAEDKSDYKSQKDKDSHPKKKKRHTDEDSHPKKKKRHTDEDSHPKKKKRHTDGESLLKRKRRHTDSDSLHKRKRRLAEGLIAMISENIENMKKIQEDMKKIQEDEL